MRQTRMLGALVLGVLVAVGSTGVAQDKVIKKTTDKDSGFEKQLTEVDMMHQTANQLMSAGQWAEAAAELEKVVAAEGDRMEAWGDLAKCYKQLRQFDKAAGAYAAAHKLQPGNIDLLSNLGYAQLNSDQLEAAVKTYEQMLGLDSLSYDANVHLGFIFQKKDDLPKAAAYYEKALEGRANDVATMGSLGRIYYDLGDTEKSIAIYDRAIAAAEPKQKKQLLAKLGKSQLEAKNWEKAADAYAQLVELEPEKAANQYNLGISLLQADRHKEAAPCLERVIELQPDYVQAYQYLASCYNETGRYDQAIATVRKGLAIAEQKAGLYCAWGRSLEKLELYDEAMEKYQLAVNDPQYGGYAKKQIQRQIDLKKRQKMMKGR